MKVNDPMYNDPVCNFIIKLLILVIIGMVSVLVWLKVTPGKYIQNVTVTSIDTGRVTEFRDVQRVVHKGYGAVDILTKNDGWIKINGGIIQEHIEYISESN